MALLLLKSGKQILRSSLSSAAVAARSHQQLSKGVTAAAASRIQTFRYTTEFIPKKEDNDFELPPQTFKSFFTYLFMDPPSPRTPFRELLGKFLHLAEQSKNCPEDRIPSILDDIRPVLNEMLYRMTNETITRFVYEFARPAASSSLIVLDRKIKDLVDKLPSHCIHLFQDMLIDMINATYIGGSFSVDFDSKSKSVVLTADVSDIGKEHLKLFVVKDYLMITGTDKDAPPALALDAKIHNILKMPSCLYSRDKLTGSILEDQEQGSRRIKIVVPKTEVLVDNPRVFQLNLNTQGAHQG